ncbi:hypothetical protein [Cellulomonas bogoriensis]|uniref:CARDB domain-containing protein n=1 Tax=Cellulomonas bogoriensis 69B4 = DSM 16987 TaxID=1386082 RepID=A0A0A0BYY9_9CELL|nr:hypothetical protein [Cellulomonas bogoriensis]KGM13160.1 hypothetical protein N869_15740 [Cellulomonas bogoriensis 69B4 = DSM 16987]
MTEQPERGRPTREEDGKDQHDRKDEHDPKDPPLKEPTSAWLVVRYDVADHGYRPIPPGDPSWLSPDVWVTGGTDMNTVIEGVPFTVHARVWNLGAFPATPTWVQFAVVDPAMGISAPQVIGTGYIPHLPPLSSASVACPEPWVRESVGGGHPCLLVKASSVPMDPAPASWNVRQHRHVGQRNLTVVPAGTSSLSLTLTTTAVLQDRPIRLAVTGVAGGRAEDVLRPAPTALRAARAALDEAEGRDVVALRRRVETLTRLERTAPQVKELDLRDAARVKGLDPTKDGQQQVHVDLELPDVEELLVHVWQLEGEEPTGGYSVLVTRQDALDLRAVGTHVTGGLADPRNDHHPPKERTEPMVRDDAAGDRDTHEGGAGEQELDLLVLEHYPAVRITRDLARQLLPMLPMRSKKDLHHGLERTGLVVEGVKLPFGGALEAVPEEAFPIEDPKDLVAKVAAAVRIATSMVSEGRTPVLSERLARVALEVAGTPAGAGRAGIPAGHFTGPSVFGSTKEV